MTPRTRTAILAGALAVAAILVFLLVGPRGTEAPRTSTPLASPTASGSASPTTSATLAATTGIPAPTTAPTATPAPAASGRYGYVVVGGGALALTDEAGTAIQRHACGFPGRGCSQQMIAVSPDGRRVAFWRTAPGARWELATFEAAMPATVRSVAVLPDGMEGLSLAWAADSRGLLYAAQTTGYGGITGGAGRATLSGIEATTAGPAADVMPARTDGSFYVPIAWDRAKNVVAAVTSGEGGFVLEYVVTVGDRTTVSRAAPGQLVAAQVQASPDATRVLALDMGANVLRIWQLTDFATQVQVGPGPNGRITAALWRTSMDVGWTYGDSFGVFIPQTDSSRNVYRAAGARLVAMRPDGTAALVASSGQPNVSADLFIVDIERGTAAARTAMDAGQVVVPRGLTLP